jgi:predicted DNA-binding transcriptional regulator AlpA
MASPVLEFERPLSEHEVGELLGVSVNTLKHWRWIGRGPRYVQLGRKIGYRPGDLREWIDQSVTDPGPAAGR